MKDNVIVVLLSAYNGEKYIKEQIDTILAQKGVRVKLIVRDDGSKDATIDVVNHYVEKYPDCVELIIGENVGFARSFSKLIEYAYSKYPDIQYFSFADQDDFWLDNKLKAALQKIKEIDKDKAIAYCSQRTAVDSQLKVLKRPYRGCQKDVTKERALIQNFATGCTMVFNRKAASLYISHPVRDLKVHDFHLYQICCFMGEVIYDDQSYILYRQHGNNQIGSQSFIGRMKKRFQGHFRDRQMECQNYNFYEAFKNDLSPEDQKLFSDFLGYRKSLIKRLKLLFSKKIKYINFESNIFLVIKILIGRV